MSGTILAGLYTHSVTLSLASENPATVTGTISVASGGGLAGPSPTAWTIVNEGSIGGATYGVSLGAGGLITNAAGAEISAATAAITVPLGSASIANSGTIIGSDGVSIGQAGFVSNAYGGLIEGTSHHGIALNSGTVINAGSILGIGQFYSAIYATGTADVTNALSGVIFSDYHDINVLGAVYVVNAGKVIDTNTIQSPILMKGGGTVVNGRTGTIAAAYHAIHASSYAAAIINTGLITDSNTYFSAIALKKGGTVVNGAGGRILAAYHAIYVSGGGTITNAGTLAATGANTIAVDFVGGFNNLLLVEPGAVFDGGVLGGNPVGLTSVSTLELGAGVGTLPGIGSSFYDFGSIAFDPGAQWRLYGSIGGLARGEAISGFAPGDTLELTGTVESYSTFASGVLTLSGGTTIALPGAVHIGVTASGGDTIITACFAEGTQLASACGPTPVEELREGDLLLTASGRLAPVRWLGHRCTSLRQHPRPHDVMPVRVRAGAFAPAQPGRDLVLSPDHAVFVDGHLVPIRHLVNGVSIVQEARDRVTYWHVELDRHDVILAEGMPCETYLDTGNRGAFGDTQGPTDLHPDFARAVWARAVWAAAGCAPILTDPATPRLRALHTRTLARASVPWQQMAV